MVVAKKFLALGGAVALTIQPTVAAAQDRPCITEQEVSALVVYVVPIAIDGVRVRCVGQLSPSGFVAQRSGALQARYEALRDATWPEAKSAFLKFSNDRNFANDKDREFAEQFENLPDEALRPFIDGVLTQKLADEINGEECGEIERVMEAMDPFDPSAVGTLVGVIASMSVKKPPRICPVQGT
jgi:hypothetical protein